MQACPRPWTPSAPRKRFSTPSTKSDSLLRSKSNTAPKLSGLVHYAIGNHILHGADVMDVLEWIAIQDNEVATLSRFHGTGFLIKFHHACRHDRCRLNRFPGREAGLRVEFDLT